MGCINCPLRRNDTEAYQACTKARGPVVSRDNSNVRLSRPESRPKIMYIGEAPGKVESKTGYPFVGLAGQLLDRYIAEVGLTNVPSVWTNITKCMPLDESAQVRPPDVAEISSCLPYLVKDILVYRPEFIVPVGGTSLKVLTGASSISRNHGRVYSLDLMDIVTRNINENGKTKTAIDGYAALIKSQLNGYAPKIVPIIHPASVLYGSKKYEAFIIQDLSIISRTLVEADQTVEHDYEFLAALEDVEQYFDHIITLYESKEIEFITLDCETCGADGDEDLRSLTPYNMSSRLLSMSISHQPYQGRMMYVEHRDCEYGNTLGLAAFSNLLQRLVERVPVSNQNIKYDYSWVLQRLGVEIKTIYFDTMNAHHYLYKDTEPHDLDYLVAKNYSDLAGYKTEFWDKIGKVYGGQIERAPLADVLSYSCGDADAAYRLTLKFRDQLAKMDLPNPFTDETINALDSCNTVFIKPIKAVASLDRAGMKLDLPRAQELKVLYENEIQTAYADLMYYEESHEVLRRFDAFNLNSPLQMKYFYFDVLRWPYSLDRRTGVPIYSSSRQIREHVYDIFTTILKEGMTEGLRVASFLNIAPESLKDLPNLDLQRNIEIIDIISRVKGTMNRKGSQKMVSQYLNPIEKWVSDDGLVHPNHFMIGTASDRYTTPGIPVQTIPPKEPVKEIYVSRWKNQGGLILSADESQIELRLIASMAHEQSMIQAFADGIDIHQFVASRVYRIPLEKVSSEQRRFSKQPSFAVIYGGTAETIAYGQRDSHAMTLDMAQDLMKDYFEMFPAIPGFMEDMKNFGRQHGFTITPFGTMRPLPHINDVSDPGKRAYDERVSFNSPVQGAANDLVVGAIADLYENVFSWTQSKMFAFIHDSVATDIYPGELLNIMQFMHHYMEVIPAYRHRAWLKTPLRVDFQLGAGWGFMLDVTQYDFDTQTMTLSYEVKDREVFVKRLEMILAEFANYGQEVEVSEPRVEGKNIMVDVKLR